MLSIRKIRIRRKRLGFLRKPYSSAAIAMRAYAENMELLSHAISKHLHNIIFSEFLSAQEIPVGPTPTN